MGKRKVAGSIPIQVPRHFVSMYPRFIKFLEAYYDWFYNNNGTATPEEMSQMADVDWEAKKQELFESTGDSKYLIMSADQVKTEQMILMNKVSSPGGASIDIAPLYLLERRFDTVETTDGELFETADGDDFESSHDVDDEIARWSTTFGMDTVPSDVDGLRLVRLIRALYEVKGTAKSMQLFFHIFFGDDITIEYPKEKIAIADGMFIADGDTYLRDDVYYNEYTYVIKTPHPIETYQPIFDMVYIKKFHPAGFNAVLEQA